jgi:Cu+-exporting ATPase
MDTDIKLPIEGLEQVSFEEAIYTALTALPGVSNARIDAENQTLLIHYDSDQIDLVDICDTVQKAGGTLPVEKVKIKVRGMSCMGCVARVAGALADVTGVLEADVQLSRGSAGVSFVRGLVSPQSLEQAVRDAGYQPGGLEPFAGLDEQKMQESVQEYPVSRFDRLKRLFQRG